MKNNCSTQVPTFHQHLFIMWIKFFSNRTNCSRRYFDRWQAFMSNWSYNFWNSAQWFSISAFLHFSVSLYLLPTSKFEPFSASHSGLSADPFIYSLVLIILLGFTVSFMLNWHFELVCVGFLWFCDIWFVSC